MEDANVWEVDRIAATELFELLNKTPETEWAQVIAKAFSKARFQNSQWAATRVHERAIKLLEVESRAEFQRREPSWADGFRHAEECLMSSTPSELLESLVLPPQSRGQVLRSLIRSARLRSAP